MDYKLVVKNGKLAAISGARKHYACLCDVALVDRVRARCQLLGCSQGVYLEILFTLALEQDLVKPEALYHYFQNGGVSGENMSWKHPGDKATKTLAKFLDVLSMPNKAD